MLTLFRALSRASSVQLYKAESLSIVRIKEVYENVEYTVNLSLNEALELLSYLKEHEDLIKRLKDE